MPFNFWHLISSHFYDDSSGNSKEVRKGKFGQVDRIAFSKLQIIGSDKTDIICVCDCVDTDVTGNRHGLSDLNDVSNAHRV